MCSFLAYTFHYTNENYTMKILAYKVFFQIFHYKIYIFIAWQYSSKNTIDLFYTILLSNENIQTNSPELTGMEYIKIKRNLEDNAYCYAFLNSM